MGGGENLRLNRMKVWTNFFRAAFIALFHRVVPSDGSIK
jgi:hypothetical protein